MDNATLTRTISVAIVIFLAVPSMAMSQTGADSVQNSVGVERDSPFDVGPLAPLRSSALESPLGQTVRTANGENGGRVVDLLTDPNGMVRAAVIEFGGFLGIGSRKVAVAWHAVRFQPNGRTGGVVVDITPEQLRTAPEYKGGSPSIVDQSTESAY